MSRIGDIIKDKVSDTSGMEMVEISSETLDSRIDYILDEIEDGIKDTRIHELVSRIMKEANVASRDYEGESEAIFNWVRQNIRYTLDPTGIELFRKPVRTVELGQADCDDMSILICALLGSIGHVLILRIIGVTSKQPEHIYPVDLLPPDNPEFELALDATRPEEIGWEISENQWKFHKDYEVFETD